MKGNTACCLIVIILFVDVCVAPDPSIANKIKHVVVLMEENRSYDHMCGWFQGANGLTGKEYNLVNSSDPNSAVYVDNKGPFVAPCDPDHGTAATTFKIYASANDSGTPSMSGFVAWEAKRGNAKTNYCDVMSMQSVDHVPILSALADQFVIMDRFFADYPGPTWPNRLYMLTATSAGCTSTGTFYHDKVGSLYPQKTFFAQVSDAGLTWRNYFNDTPWELFVEGIALHPENLKSMEHFYEDARTGNLPSFSWINPRAAINITLLQGSNDQHPDHDVALGERYYKDIYEALRASPSWNETLFIVTYDEHGGFYDHVLPPTNVPAPDNQTSYPDQGVLFNRLGVRIPTLLISPWLPKGAVVSGPPAAQKPTSNSEYSLSSILATTRLLLGMPTTPLTQRDAWSATFEHLFANLSAPRTDCPLHLPAPPPPTHIFGGEENLPVNELQKNIMEMHANLAGVPFPTHIQTQGQVSEWLQAQFSAHTETTSLWKHSKTTRIPLSLSLPLLSHASHIAHNPSTWSLHKSESGFFLISTLLRDRHMCMDISLSEVGMSLCYPRADADASLDPTQRWVWETSTVRPWSDQSLCLTQEDRGVNLQLCDESKTQQWVYVDGMVQSFNGAKIQVTNN